MINLIVAVDENWAIGNSGGMLFHIPEDLAYFKKITSGKTVFMGRKTLESLPGQKPLPNRRNVVVSRDTNYSGDGFEVAHSFDELFTLIKNEDEVFNIGGDSIYKALLDYSETAYVTKMKNSAENADSFFPNLDENANWELFSQSDIMTDNGIEFQFLVYKNLNTKKYL